MSNRERAVGRRELFSLTVVASVVGVAGCDTKSADPARGSSTSSASFPLTPKPTSATAKGKLSTAVLKRLSDSAIPVDLSVRHDLNSASTSHIDVVGDIDPFYVKLAASYAQKTVDYFEPSLSTPVPGKTLILLAKTKEEYVAWGGWGPTTDYSNYVFGRGRRAPGWAVLNGGLPMGSTASIMTEPILLEPIVRAETFHAMIFATVTKLDRVPRWVTDGFTLWAQATLPLTDNYLSTYFTEHPPAPVVPTNDAEFKHDPHDLAAGRAFLFVYYLAVRFGEATALSFCQHVIEHRNVSPKREFPRVFGVSLIAAEKAWAAQYEQQIAIITGTHGG